MRHKKLKIKKERLDDILIKLGLAEDKKVAFVKVTEGKVFVDGQKAISPSQLVQKKPRIEIRGESEYVGRGALKLKAALEGFGIEVLEKVCADIGAATGGFTEVLLKRGAKKVYAIDTARGKLALKLRENPRVVVVEGTDVRDLKNLPEKVEIITIDVSLVSLRGILFHAGRFLKEGGSIVALFKPQYEVRDRKVLKHGVVWDDASREKLLRDFKQWAGDNGWEILDWMESPIRGNKGNLEYLLWLRLY